MDQIISAGLGLVKDILDDLQINIENGYISSTTEVFGVEIEAGNSGAFRGQGAIGNNRGDCCINHAIWPRSYF